jgi:hypothetical protein
MGTKAGVGEISGDGTGTYVGVGEIFGAIVIEEMGEGPRPGRLQSDSTDGESNGKDIGLKLLGMGGILKWVRGTEEESLY